MTFAFSSSAGRDTAHRTSKRSRIASRLVDRALPSLQAGRLRIILPNGDVIDRRGNQSGPEATMSVQRWRALWLLMLDGDPGFADGYINGDWSTPDLSQLLQFCARNESALSSQAKSFWLNLVRTRLTHSWRKKNTRRGSRRNIAAHYDLGNEFFRLWLDSGMNYSSALFVGADTLEQAQQAKLDRIAHLLDLEGGERVLEIGCGWGALAERLIRHFGSTVVGVTLSSEQLDYSRSRLAGEIENGRADLGLTDYRDIQGRFDRIASIEMIEAVGQNYWPVYFAKLRTCLRDGGIALLQAITIDERRFPAYRRHPDFIQRYIFPGGMLPTCAIIEQEAARAGLKLVHHEPFGESYARTVCEWKSQFLQAWPKIETLGFNQRFRKMWEYYLTYCEVGFRLGAIDVGFFKFTG